MSYASLPLILFFFFFLFFFFLPLSAMQSLHASMFWRLLAASAVYYTPTQLGKELHKLHILKTEIFCHTYFCSVSFAIVSNL